MKNILKRTRKQNKVMKEMVKHLDQYYGEILTGSILSIVCDGLDAFTQDGARNLRTIEIKFNNFYSISYDFTTKEIKMIGMQ